MTGGRKHWQVGSSTRRSCAVCHEPMTGRRHRKTCSERCRHIKNGQQKP